MDKYQDIDIPTPTPRPTSVYDYGDVEINVDLVGFDHVWASEAIQMWNMIPTDFQTGIQTTTIFMIFAFAFIFVIKILRREKQD